MLMQTEPAATGTSVFWQHATYRILLTPADTNGSVGMFEAVHAPNAGPPRHVHTKEDETIFIIEGSARFWLEGATFTRQAGDVVFIPKGKQHTFFVLGDNPARFLTSVTPGGFEAFFPAVAREHLRFPEDLPRVREIGMLYNAEFTGPPMQA